MAEAAGRGAPASALAPALEIPGKNRRDPRPLRRVAKIQVDLVVKVVVDLLVLLTRGTILLALPPIWAAAEVPAEVRALSTLRASRRP